MTKSGGFYKATWVLQTLLASLPTTPVGRAAWALSIAAAVFIACFDPFDLGTRSETAADAVVQRLGEHRSPSAAADAITVVEVTRGTLVEPGLNVRYPLSYGSQATLVQTAAASGAAVVFLDFEYLRDAVDPDGMWALAQAIADARAAGIPVLTGPIAAGRADLAPLRSVATSTAVWLDRAHPADYPLLARPPGGSAAPTAAVELFRVICRRMPSRFAGCARPFAASDSDAIALHFGGVDLAGSKPFIPEREMARCTDGGTWRSLRAALLGRSRDDPCPRYLTVPAQFPLKRPDETVQAALRGRAVLIGAGPGLGDDKSIPGVGTVPGVLLHAVALDTLLVRGGSYPSWPGDLSSNVKVGLDELLKLATIVLLPPLATLAATRLEHGRGAGRLGRLAAAWLMVAILVGLGGSLVILAILGRIALDWPVAMAVLVAALSTLALGLASTAEVGRVLAPLNTVRMAWGVLTVSLFATVAVMTGLWIAITVVSGLLAVAFLGRLGTRWFREARRTRARARATEETS